MPVHLRCRASRGREAQTGDVVDIAPTRTDAGRAFGATTLADRPAKSFHRVAVQRLMKAGITVRIDGPGYEEARPQASLRIDDRRELRGVAARRRMCGATAECRVVLQDAAH